VTGVDGPTQPDDVELVRPARPASVELAAAILIVCGAVQLISGIISLSSIPPGVETFAALVFALNVASIALGLIVRTGRAWLVAINFAAILGFLDLLGSGGSPLSLMLGAAEVLVVAILLARKPWFDAMSVWREDETARKRA
jgi:hypothetical protein